MRLKFTLYLLAALFIAGCSPAQPTPAATQALMDAPVTESATLTPAPTFTDVPTLVPTAVEEVPPTLTATPAPTPCAWIWAYGDSSALTEQLQTTLDDAQIFGKLKTQSSGENGGDDCSYHEMDVTAEITIYVVDPADLPALTALATRIEEILQSAASQYDHKATLTNPRSVLIFKGATGSTAKDCRWDFAAQTCQ